MDDGDGRNSRLCLWNHPGDDVTGMVGRCEKVVTTMEDLLGGEVYHYHTKLIMKEAHTGDPLSGTKTMGELGYRFPSCR